MKKFAVISSFLLFIYTIFPQDIFIQVPKGRTIIGNDFFSIKQKRFTGVSGEFNEQAIKYFAKEHLVCLDKFSISKYLVTNEEFHKFRLETKYKTLYEKERDVVGDLIYAGKINANYPMERATFLDAIAYSQWYSDVNKKIYRLPTSAEWEYAALFGEKKFFPWGNEDKILSSTETDEVVTRYKFPVTQIIEDTSGVGVSNLMGGYEYTIDCYDDAFYEKSPIENPLCLIPVQAILLKRGIPKYNEMDRYGLSNKGLYDFWWGSISSYFGSSFRLVEDFGTIFNKDTQDECIWFLNRAESKVKEMKVYIHPNEKSDFEMMEVESEFYILLKSINSLFYKVYFQVYEYNTITEKMEKSWRTGWVSYDSIFLTNKKWYE